MIDGLDNHNVLGPQDDDGNRFRVPRYDESVDFGKFAPSPQKVLRATDAVTNEKDLLLRARALRSKRSGISSKFDTLQRDTPMMMTFIAPFLLSSSLAYYIHHYPQCVFFYYCS